MRHTLALLIATGTLWGALLQSFACDKNGESASDHGPRLVLELLALDSALGPRGPRPFIAGEDVHIALSVSGGKAPYEVQVLTSTGDPRLASASTTLPASTSPNASAGLRLTLGSEVATGTYALKIRVSDGSGKGSSITSDEFEVVGSDAPVRAEPDPPLHLRVVDVAGRSRQAFFQGEAIAIRATLTVPQDVAIAIVASDERAFMPAQRYAADTVHIDIPLQVPRLARVGTYRVDVATSDSKSSVPLIIVGTSYAAAFEPVLADFNIYGGPEFRIPQTAVLRRGEALRVEAIVGGLRTQGKAHIRLRTRVGKQVASHEFPLLVPADTHPEARTLLQAPWTPSADLGRGRHMLELEIEEDGKLSTLYREVVLQ